MMEKVLIANRGEIALRILRACRDWASRPSPSTRRPTATSCTCARRRVGLHRPAAPSRDSYLHIPAIISRRRGQRHRGHPPGLRFPVRERRLRRAVERSGFVFIGPKPDTIRLMGDKVSAIRAMKAGRRALTVPGSDGPLDRTTRR
jgi:acetyl-CoA carboxylase biotin carboxylase subunit